MAGISSRKKKDCGCGKCPTWAEITEYTCGCVKVDIHNDRNPCAECTNFSGKRRSCPQRGRPEDHKG